MAAIASLVLRCHLRHQIYLPSAGLAPPPEVLEPTWPTLLLRSAALVSLSFEAPQPASGSNIHACCSWNRE